MRILKSENINEIIGEMLNIETGKFLYKNGARVNDQSKSRYPEINVDDVNYSTHAVEGCIIVRNINENFIRRIKVQLDNKTDALKAQHMSSASMHTFIKTASIDSVAQHTIVTGGFGKHSYLRSFRMLRDHPKLSMIKSTRRIAKQVPEDRFIWYIASFEDLIRFKITNLNFEAAYTVFVCGVLIDSKDLLKWRENDIIYEFGLRDFKSAATYLPQYKICQQVENNVLEYWRKYNIMTNNMRQIKTVVYEMPEIIRSNIAEVVKGHPDACAKCHSKTYGHTYVLYGLNIREPTKPRGLVICPLCLHTDMAEPALETKYKYIFRTVFNDISEYSRGIADAELRDIYGELARANEKIFMHGIELLCIGDKYLACPERSIAEFIMEADEQEIAGKKIILTE